MHPGIHNALRNRKDHLRRAAAWTSSAGDCRRRRLPDFLVPFPPRLAGALRYRPHSCYTQDGFGAGGKEPFLTHESNFARERTPKMSFKIESVHLNQVVVVQPEVRGD